MIVPRQVYSLARGDKVVCRVTADVPEFVAEVKLPPAWLRLLVLEALKYLRREPAATRH